MPAAWWVALLACAVVWAQLAGLVHRIDHAGGAGGVHGAAAFQAVDDRGAQASSAEAKAATSAAALHSCVLFDGLCLADSLPTALAPLVVSRMAQLLPLAAAFASWHALFVSHFLSRGPPAAA